MNRRYAHRKAVKALGRTDRFTDLMSAVTGGGSSPCAACGIAFPSASLRDDGACPACARTMKRLRVSTPTPVLLPATKPAEPNVVYVDASYRDGCAGLAVVGALGDHSRWAEASSSMHAEHMALRWALDLGLERNMMGLTFRTDCQRLGNNTQTPKRMGWVVEWVPRRRNQAADRMAWDARVSVAA